MKSNEFEFCVYYHWSLQKSANKNEKINKENLL